jgi:hypothetical protein
MIDGNLAMQNHFQYEKEREFNEAEDQHQRRQLTREDLVLLKNKFDEAELPKLDYSFMEHATEQVRENVIKLVAERCLKRKPTAEDMEQFILKSIAGNTVLFYKEILLGEIKLRIDEGLMPFTRNMMAHFIPVDESCLLTLWQRSRKGKRTMQMILTFKNG